MSDLAQVRAKLAAGELGVALSDLETHLGEMPDDLEALYLQAVALRYARQPQPALDTLARLKRLAPGHSRAHQEEGHLYRDAGAGELALQAYGRALRLNPSLVASLRESVEILHGLERPRLALQMQGQLQRLLAVPEELRTVMDLISQNKLLKAEEICRAFLLKQPDSVDGMRLLADIGIRLGVLEDAEFLLESAVAFEPDDLHVQMEYVNVLRKRQKFAAAKDQALKLLAAHPDNLQVKSQCAVEHMQTGEFDKALDMLENVLQEIPEDPQTLVTYGHALKTSDRAEAAVAAYAKAAVARPQHGESHYALANLKTYRFSAEQVDQMLGVHDDPDLGFMDRVYVNFALGKAYEDRAEFARAFDFYQQGNALKKAQSRYDAQQMAAEMRAVAQTCTADFFGSHSRSGCEDPAPIFVVGLPRAGSTLLEQILASHSQIDGTLELPNILSLSQRLRRRKDGGGYPAVLNTLSTAECREMGEAFIEDTRIHRAGAPFFIDKMPNNFRHIGLIKMILPRAKIIDARRDAMACCFSGYKQLFAEGQEFSYDLRDIGHYYLDYEALMAHWARTLPGFVLQVNNEDVVADLEGQVRRMLEFCELPFEAACLRFYETERNIRTPSSQQVRQPISSAGVEQWRHFEPWLGPLREALAGRSS
ncbi:MAG: sulfotransferase [Pseudomonadota bacterium]